MTAQAFALFDTALGPCAIAWSVAGITALLGGQVIDLGEVALDLDGISGFGRRVYEVARDTVTKQRLLLIERARISPEAVLFDDPAFG